MAVRLFKRTPTKVETDPVKLGWSLPQSRWVRMTGTCPDPACGRVLTASVPTVVPPGCGCLSTRGQCRCGHPVVLEPPGVR